MVFICAGLMAETVEIIVISSANGGIWIETDKIKIGADGASLLFIICQYICIGRHVVVFACPNRIIGILYGGCKVVQIAPKRILSE